MSDATALQKILARQAPTLSGPDRVEWSSMRSRVYAQIRDAIVSGRVQPGTTITIRTLAASLGTSAMPVREAIMRLVSEGAIELHDNRTFSVVRLSPVRFTEIRDIRLKVEGWAAEIAATRISTDELEQLRFIQGKMAQEGSSNGDRYLIFNRHFHFTIYNAARMPELVNIIESLWIKYGPTLHYHSRALDARNEGNHLHTVIIDALSRGDSTAANQALQADINAASEFIFPHIKAEPKSAQEIPGEWPTALKGSD